ncbi:hypothetical protein [Methylorubrum extorquens]|uniref:Uncharacterized protein n=1 Tax=Methylorubrum extorquens (strain ATCC 14718 / DSM 1338 / JCM 2805 / NCIMB 9133 / AM1) TaxID=272630 RepID=C5B6V1_METEA|nr:hypothetical protein [Methylorubrum extorquens]ACS44183.1 Hypothetical protein MexAM1_p3METAp0007 [Methylorubrum extorquens AM1]MCP1591998.1 hypothetical protein [Methylorubrum extorquens]
MASKPRNRAGMDAEAVARMMAAQDAEETQGPAPEPEPAPVAPAPVPPAPADLQPPAPPVQSAPEPPAFDPGKVDGRTLRRTFREPFATRIKPEAHEALRRIAYHRRITIAEALEMAVAAFEKG